MMTPSDEPTTVLFRALMHPIRLAILDLLRQGEQCVCHLEAYLGKRQAYISQQLMVLREAGLIIDERDGLNVYYHVRDPRVFVLLDTARAMQGIDPGSQRPSLPADACPCPKCAPAADLVLYE
jgi:DNA-binding transcriptional ArsR family regulator